MMMRRYQDAIRTFSDILMDIQRNKVTLQNKAQLYDQVSGDALELVSSDIGFMI